MSDILTYTLSLQDQVSAKLQKIGINSDNALNIFAKLQTQTNKTSQLMKDMGGSVGSLREKLALLRQEKDWIPVKNIDGIRKYNTEIKKLEKEITRLDTINGNAFKRNLKGAIGNLPFANVITNPVAQAGMALYSAGKMAMSFDEGMAKINTTAQLAPNELKKLKSELINMGTSVGADLGTVPEAYEKILSQTGDVALSTDILKSSLMGSKAGFTEQSVVADALAQTLSLVGKENTNAQEVLDTFFAAKRVGAGEFKDFANYVPGLIAAGDALGVGFKETAGLFAYMTGKGQSAERSTMLMQNAFTALGKSEITKGLEKSGVAVFNKDGSMKQMDEIFGGLQKKLESFGKNDKAKANFLESIGLRDAQAKQAFMVLASDAAKLKETLNDVTNSQGEADKAFKLSDNPMQRIAKLWSLIQKVAISFGGVISTILVPALSGVLLVVSPVADMLSWLFTKITEGNPIILGLAAIIGVLTVAYYWNKIAAAAAELWTKRKIITDKLAAFWAGVVAAATNLWTGAQWLLNAALNANPVALIIIGVIALIAIITFLIIKIDGWRTLWSAVVQFMKYSFFAFVEGVKLYYSTLINGILIGLDTIKLGWYKFRQTLGEDVSSDIAKINADVEARKKAITDGAKKVAEYSAKSVEGFKNVKLTVNDTKFSDIVGGIKQKLGIGTNSALQNAVGGGGSANNGDGTAKGAGKSASETIATGGTRNTSINVTIKSMIENLVMQGGTGENAKEIERNMAEAFYRMLGMVSVSAK